MAPAQKKFDAKLYAAAYPDVKLSGLTPQDHYERYGRMLSRDPAPVHQRINSSQRGYLSQLSFSNGSVISQDSLLTPALLDLQFAQGVIPNGDPILHEDLVSIIMPSYNNEAWLARAIHSALSQQSVNVELIVVDDGSTDNSVVIAQEIARNWPNMRVISLLRNFGCYYARNIAVMNATGRWITLLDSDDIMAPNRILHQLNAR